MKTSFLQFRLASMLAWFSLASILLPAQTQRAADLLPKTDNRDGWQIPSGQNLLPHFEAVGSRKVLYVDGMPFTVLAVEIPWWDLVYGRYEKTFASYDYLYPASEKMGLNTLKVPVKWSMVEPKQGAFDFSYVDHAKHMAEKHHLKLVLNWFGHYASGDGTLYANLAGDVYAPMYVIEDEKTYPRAVDEDGVAHHNVASYDYEPILAREVAAFRALMQHLKEVDSVSHTVVMIQVENEIAVFGWDRTNTKLWRDHSPASNQKFRERGFADDLHYSAWNLSYNWIRRLTDAGADVYPLPFFLNFVGGNVADWMVGGAPGEDVPTYLKNCPNLSFIGVNSYFCGEWRPDNSCAKPSEATVDELRKPFLRYRVSRNLPAITETNSGNSPTASRLAYLAVGQFGAPIFAPWALTDSYPEDFQPYVLPDGTLANGAWMLRDTYSSLSKALAQISYYAGSDKLKVFMANSPGESFSQTEEVNGSSVAVSGAQNGQAIVIQLSDHEFLFVGYRVNVSLENATFRWPMLKNVQVERGRWSGQQWVTEGEPAYWINQSKPGMILQLDVPQAVRVSW
ncbi:DUF5597 domain-containing protein [Edaphobacter bradus]|uniref:DUF5597 domain-containing protein n=1 Tax=Edaphobacter bradus TaxID=2259016 RepID=UPI0021DF7195|nr:DUF5597 domain-containing protein [Edaphobacter bradus]